MKRSDNKRILVLQLGYFNSAIVTSPFNNLKNADSPALPGKKFLEVK